MNAIVVSYSMTGNNHALAKSVAEGLNAEHTALTETKKRTMGTTVLDLLFNRTPKVQPSADVLTGRDAVVLAGPVWIGLAATPLRAYMKKLKKLRCPYAFLSISGGTDSDNPKIPAELRRRVKRDAAAVIDLHIADLLPKEPKPTRDATSAYQLMPNDVKTLTEQALPRLKAALGEDKAS